MASSAPRSVLAQRVRLRSTLSGIAAQLVGAGVVFLYLLFASTPSRGVHLPIGEITAWFAVYMVIGVPLGQYAIDRWGRPLDIAIGEGQPLVGDARRVLFNIPRRVALVSFVGWTLAAGLFMWFDIGRIGDSAVGALRLGLIIVLGGVTTTATVYLSNEWALRPLFALAFSDAPPAGATGMRVADRFLLAWALAAGVPLIGVSLAFVHVADLVAVRRLVIPLVAIGLVTGAVIIQRVARSFASPLRALRDAVERVADGDTTVEVTVDDASELGLLQFGFNHMVAGIRERNRIQDLFGRHVGLEVARHAIAGGAGLGGEQRDISALFLDVIGSTSLAAQRPPTEVVEMLNALFAAVVAACDTEGGWVNKFEGDAALCVFGAPAAQPDHRDRALRTARDLRSRVVALAAEYPDLAVGIGVSSGLAVAGNVGAEDRYEYTVIGDPVNEAARLTEQAKSVPGRVLASGAAVTGASDESHAWHHIDDLVLRGRSEATALYAPSPT